jgi:hypothetical protein
LAELRKKEKLSNEDAFSVDGWYFLFFDQKVPLSYFCGNQRVNF